eukprot:sb/3466552/
METIWHHTFRNELGVSPEEQPLLIAEHPFGPKDNREKTTQIMFETFNVPSLFLSPQAVLSLYASGGRTTGVVVDCGDDMTHVVPVYDGHCLPHAVSTLAIGGRDLTDVVFRVLSERRYYLRGPITKEPGFVEMLKKKFCYVAQDYEQEMGEWDKTKDRTWEEEPDSDIITIGNQIQIGCPEVLFKPTMVGVEGSSGVGRMVVDSIERCDPGIKEDLYANICVSGGGALFRGFRERLEREITALEPTSSVTRVGEASPRVRVGEASPSFGVGEASPSVIVGEASPSVIVGEQGGQLSAWKGASALVAEGHYDNRWVKREEYEEYGPTIVHWRCAY